MINIMQPSLGEEELEAVRKVFESNWIGKGRLLTLFEEEFAAQVGATREHVLTTNCCTEGLFASMYLFDIKPGDEVICGDLSFVGVGNAILNCGAKMVICDVDPRTLNPTAETIERVITPRTKAILLSHYGGIACEMDEIMALANAHNLYVIEDAAPGVCSKYKGKALGTVGDMGMWSFDAMKILVTGDGAAIYLKDPMLRNKCDKWFYFGMNVKSGSENSVAQKWWEFDVECYGHRAIMNNIGAAIGLEQLKKLPLFMERRAYVHETYNQELKNIDWLVLPPALPDYVETSYYFYHVQLPDRDRDAFARFLRENNIYTTYRYFPFHRVPGFHCLDAECPGADYATDHTLCLPIHQSLSESDVAYIIETIKKF